MSTDPTLRPSFAPPRLAPGTTGRYAGPVGLRLRPLAAALALLVPLLSSCESPTVQAQAPDPGVAPHTHDAADIVSGVLDDDLFSPTIRIIDRDTVRFGGVLSWGGGPPLATSDLGGLVSGLDSLSARLDRSELRIAELEGGHEHAGEDITSGTIPDTRLTGNVALLTNPLTRFEGGLGWGDGPALASSSEVARGGGSVGSEFTSQRNVFTQPQTFFHRLLVATFTGEPTEGSGTVGLRFDRNRDTQLSPLGMSWTLSGAERWALGLDADAESFPDFVLLYNTGVGDIFRVGDGAHFQMGAGVGPSSDDHLLHLNDRPGSGNRNVLSLQSWGEATNLVTTLDADGGVPWEVARDGTMGVGTGAPDNGLKLDVAGVARSRGWETVSDARLKEDVRPLTGVLDRIARLQAVHFRWRASGEEDVGVLAQELEEVFPELVSDRDGVKSVDYAGLTAVLLGAVAELAELYEQGTADRGGS